MQQLQDANQINEDNLKNVRREASRHFRNKRKEYLKVKNHELENNSKMKSVRDLYRGIIDLKKGSQPRTNIVQDEKGDWATDCHSILARWRNNFSQLLNVHGVDVRQTEIHTAEPLELALSAFDIEMAIEKLERHNSPSIDQIPGELIKRRGRKIHSETHHHINSIWNKEELPEEWKLIIVPIYNM